MKRKILFLIENLGDGGAEKVLTTLVQHLDKTKFDVTVCSICYGGSYENIVSKVAKHKLLLKSYDSYTGVLKIWYFIKHHLIFKWLPFSWVYNFFIPQNNDVEVAFVEGTTTRLLSASTNKKSKKIAWVHIDLHKFHWTRSVFKSDAEETKAYNSFDQIVAVSKTAEEAMRKEFRLTVPVRTVYNPIDADEIIRLSQEQIDVPQSNRIRLVSVGRLNKQKAYDRLLRILKRLKGEGLSCELWLLGEGGDRAMLEQYIQENDLSEDVKLWGFHNNPYKYLAQCDLFVCSSISEGFSTAITEALILGLPVVSTEVSGVREQLTNGCGLITENDEEALHQGLKSVLDHPERLNEMREMAIERGRDFRIESLMKEIENVLS
ncbi:MAG: glycosyltransferase [Prevotellaceae bacterium]|nr:glycosyltransferase [Candidatus Minthosoma equi]